MQLPVEDDWDLSDFDMDDDVDAKDELWLVDPCHMTPREHYISFHVYMCVIFLTCLNLEQVKFSVVYILEVSASN